METKTIGQQIAEQWVYPKFYPRENSTTISSVVVVSMHGKKTKTEFPTTDGVAVAEMIRNIISDAIDVSVANGVLFTCKTAAEPKVKESLYRRKPLI